MWQQGVTAILNVLDKVEQVAKETPPVDNKASRFGNPAFRTFYDKISEVSSRIYIKQCIFNPPFCSFAPNFTRRFLAYLLTPCSKSPHTSANLGATGLVSTMEVEWS